MPTPCAVTGTLQTLTGGLIAQGKVIFQLTNIGTGNPVGVSGTSLIPALTYTVMTSQNGTFAVNLWGNDVLTPSNTLYSVTFRDFQGNEIGPVLYNITGSSVNLNTLVASGTIPPVITPGAVLLNPTAPQTITGFPLILSGGLGLLPSYNGLPLVAEGIPAIIAQVNLTGQAAPIGATTLYSVPASGAGIYRASISLDTSVSGVGTVQASILFNNGIFGGSATASTAPISLAALTGPLGNQATPNNVITFLSGASQLISYSTNAPGIGGGAQYALRIRLEYLG